MRGYLIIGTALALAITPAMAGGKGGGGGQASSSHPQESMSLNYGKIEHTYTQKKTGATKVKGVRAVGARASTVGKPVHKTFAGNKYNAGRR